MAEEFSDHHYIASIYHCLFTYKLKLPSSYVDQFLHPYQLNMYGINLIY